MQILIFHTSAQTVIFYVWLLFVVYIYFFVVVFFIFFLFCGGKRAENASSHYIQTYSNNVYKSIKYS